MNEPHLIVLFGATGDLARRKLLPGIMHLLESDLVAESRIIGVSLDDFDDEGFRTFAEKACREFTTRPLNDAQWAEFAAKLSYVNVKAGPEALAKAASALEAELGGSPGRLHYLSVPPKAALDVVHTLDAANLVERSRIIMEKPFGTDLASARSLNSQLHEVFAEEQIFRIDHFLGKERSDPRTDVGETIRDVSVSKNDRTGRAEMVTLVGDRRRTISGWEFKLIVGRALGWQFIKSSRFTVSRSGSEFVFRGGGFGHGLGLCQEGSHVMAQRGQSFQQILAHYFPGARVGEAVGEDDKETRRRGDWETGRRDDGETRRRAYAETLGRGDTAFNSAFLQRRVSLSPLHHASQSSRRLATSHFQLTYPRAVDTRDAEHILTMLESNRAELLRRVSVAGIEARFPKLEVVMNESTGEFVGRTGMPPWAAAATKNNRIELQPLTLLRQRRILETTLRHELVHVLVDSIGGGQTPRWLAEGMAVHFAGEGKMMERYQANNVMSVETVEQALASTKSAADMRSAYAAAHKIVQGLIVAEGEGKVWKRVAERRYSINRAVAPT